MEWSKGVIFLMATFWLEGLCIAELDVVGQSSWARPRLTRDSARDASKETEKG